MTLGAYDPYAGITDTETVNLTELRRLRILKGDPGTQGPRGSQGPAAGLGSLFDKNKALIVASVTHENATNGTLYFSVELGTLVYRDQDGTIYTVALTPIN